MICPCIICFLYRNSIRRFTLYATAEKLYRAVWWRITTNVFGCITEKNGRLFCCIATYFRGCNGIGDLLTRQARNFIYNHVYLMCMFIRFTCRFLCFLQVSNQLEPLKLHNRELSSPDLRSVKMYHMIYISIYLYFSLPNISAQLFISGVSTFPLTPTYN